MMNIVALRIATLELRVSRGIDVRLGRLTCGDRALVLRTEPRGVSAIRLRSHGAKGAPFTLIR